MTDAKLVDPNTYDFSKLTEHLTNEQRTLLTLERIETLLTMIVDNTRPAGTKAVLTPAKGTFKNKSR